MLQFRLDRRLLFAGADNAGHRLAPPARSGGPSPSNAPSGGDAADTPSVPATSSLRTPYLHRGLAYVICTNPRSGSWLLSEGLSSTGIAGNPREWFNALEEEQQRVRWGLETSGDASPRSYLVHVVSRGATRNGVFGLKLHYYQLGNLSAHLNRIEEYSGLPIEEALTAAFPDLRYVWLKRNDKSRQAVSYYRACQTGVWWVIERDVPPMTDTRQAVFDPQAIARLEDLLVANEGRWQRFLERCRADPLVVTYEELSGDYAGTITKVLNWLGVAPPGDLRTPPPRLRRQADHLTEAWLGQYAAFIAGRAKEAEVPLADARASNNDIVQSESERLAAPPDPASPLFAMTTTPARTIPPAWRQWIANALLQDVSHETIVETMGEHGFDPDLVVTELRAVLGDSRPGMA